MNCEILFSSMSFGIYLCVLGAFFENKFEKIDFFLTVSSSNISIFLSVYWPYCDLFNIRVVYKNMFDSFVDIIYEYLNCKNEYAAIYKTLLNVESTAPKFALKHSKSSITV